MIFLTKRNFVLFWCKISSLNMLFHCPHSSFRDSFHTFQDIFIPMTTFKQFFLNICNCQFYHSIYKFISWLIICELPVAAFSDQLHCLMKDFSHIRRQNFMYQSFTKSKSILHKMWKCTSSKFLHSCYTSRNRISIKIMDQFFAKRKCLIRIKSCIHIICNRFQVLQCII